MNIHEAVRLIRNRKLPPTVLAFILLLVPQLSAQTFPRQQRVVTYLPQGYVLSQLSGQGIVGAVEPSIANLAATNPALMAEFHDISAGVSLQAETKIKPGWIADIGYRRPPKRFLQSIGLVFPLEPLRIGLGYFQKYSAERLIDSVLITSTWEPDGTVEYVTPYMHTVIETWAVSSAFALRRVLGADDPMSIALGIHLNNLVFFESIEHVAESYSKDARQFTLTAGWLYTSPWILFFRVKVGLQYEEGVNIRGVGKYSTSEQEDGRFDVIGRTPTRLYTGITVEMRRWLSLVAGYNRVKWKEVRDDVKDQDEYALNLRVRWSTSLMTTFGVFSTDMKHALDYFNLPENAFKATYLVVGLRKHIGSLSLEAAVADSHHNSGAWREQTILKLGIGVSL